MIFYCPYVIGIGIRHVNENNTRKTGIISHLICCPQTPQWKRIERLYKQLTKIALHPNCDSTLSGKTKTIAENWL